MSRRVEPQAVPLATLDFATLLRAGDGIVIGQMAGEPLELCEHLFAATGLPSGLSAFVGGNISGSPLAARPGSFRFSSYGALFRTAEIGRHAPLDIYPLHYSRIGSAIAAGDVPCDVVLMQAARDETSGQLYAGAGRNYMFEAARRARLVVVEVNRHAPIVAGGEMHRLLRVAKSPPTCRSTCWLKAIAPWPSKRIRQPGRKRRRSPHMLPGWWLKGLPCKSASVH